MTEISMPQILKGHFDRAKTGLSGQSISQGPVADRYHLDADGRRVLVGLTPGETREFETLDSLSPSDGSGGGIAWTFGGEPTTGLEKRWLQLYAKHHEAWKVLQGERGS
jgi:hypothetical protein